MLTRLCVREGLKLDSGSLDQLCEGAQCDIRQILNMLSTWKLSDTASKMNASGTGIDDKKKKCVPLAVVSPSPDLTDDAISRPLTFDESKRL